MTTIFEITNDEMTSSITMRDCWAEKGIVTVEEKDWGWWTSYKRISEEEALNMAYELLGSGWRVVSQY